MKKAIVTTTINEPTIALKRFAQFSDWDLIVIGDVKTPHEKYDLLNCTYLHPKRQLELFPMISDIIGWNTIQRRNIGFLYAYLMGYDIVATVDDDNIPYDNWGENVLVGKSLQVDCFTSNRNIVNPLVVTNYPELWHRGFPIQYVSLQDRPKYCGKQNVIVKVQADLWDGDPDIDAIQRITKRPHVKFNVEEPYFFKGSMVPFNSQNTFIHRDLLPYYAVLPFVGRMDDIWGAYMIQLMDVVKGEIIFNKASVYQERNLQNLEKNLEDEMIGYKYTYKVFDKETPDVLYDFFPDNTKQFIDQYHKVFQSMVYE